MLGDEGFLKGWDCVEGVVLTVLRGESDWYGGVWGDYLGELGYVGSPSGLLSYGCDWE